MVLEAQMKEAGIAKIHRVKRNRFGSPPFWKPYLGEVSLRIPKLAHEYEKRREEFNRTAYSETEFAEETPPKQELFTRLYKEVSTNPMKYSLETGQGSGKWKLSARVIAAVLDTSEVTARKVITRIEFDKRVKPLDN